jgi:hypothetical protein
MTGVRLQVCSALGRGNPTMLFQLRSHAHPGREDESARHSCAPTRRCRSQLRRTGSFAPLDIRHSPAPSHLPFTSKHLQCGHGCRCTACAYDTRMIGGLAAVSSMARMVSSSGGCPCRQPTIHARASCTASAIAHCTAHTHWLQGMSTWQDAQKTSVS